MAISLPPRSDIFAENKIKEKDGRKNPKSSSHPNSLPYSEESEKSVLSCMLQNPQRYIGDAIEKISTEAFFLSAHRILFDLMVELNDSGKHFDLVVITQILRERNQIENVGGALTLSEIWDFCPTTSLFEHHLEQMVEKFTLRQIINSCTDCIKITQDSQNESSFVLDEVEKKILSIRESQKNSSIITMRQGVMHATDHIAQLIENPSAFLGIKSGITELDAITNGFHPGDMIVIAARPSVGKTSFAMNVVEHIGIEQKVPVAVFTLEMSAQQLVMRTLCSRAGLQMQRVTGALMNTDDHVRLEKAAAQMRDSPVFFDDTPGISVLELRSKARRLKRTNDIQMVVIDYLQLMRSTTRRAQDNRQVEISEISAGVKALAKELNIPVLVLAQLNRQVEIREGGKPKLSDLRESGAIEQDADLVGLLVRNIYQNKDKEDDEEEDFNDKSKDSLNEDEAELIVAKHRNGPTDVIKLQFEAEFMRFTNPNS